MGAIRLTQEKMDDYIRSLEEKGLSIQSIKCYGAVLKSLYQDLPEEKYIDGKTAARWIGALDAEGYGARTINVRLSVLNSFLLYIGKREWQCDDYCRVLDSVQPELSRTEYKRLLQAAKFLEKERTYLLIKIMGGAGVRMQELSQITAEALQEEKILLQSHRHRRYLRIPSALKKELLSYAERIGIKEGPVFIAQEGTPISRSSVYHDINSISREARVAEEKVNPRCLQKMYQHTYEAVQFYIAEEAEKAYERMIEEEQLMLGWNEQRKG